MGEGLQRATLEALCTRGPWEVTVQQAAGGSTVEHVTEADVRRVYAALREGKSTAEAVAPWPVIDGRSNCVLQLLRKAKLIKYNRSKRRWLIPGREETPSGTDDE